MAATKNAAPWLLAMATKSAGDTSYRVYGKYFDWAPSQYATGGTANDGWEAQRGGFRADYTPAGSNSFTVQGDLYHSGYNETLTIPSFAPPFSSSFPEHWSI